MYHGNQGSIPTKPLNSYLQYSLHMGESDKYNKLDLHFKVVHTLLIMVNHVIKIPICFGSLVVSLP